MNADACMRRADVCTEERETRRKQSTRMQLLLDRLAAMALLDGCCAHHLDELLLDGQDKGRVKERAQVCSRTCIVPEKQKRAAEPRGKKVVRFSLNQQQLRKFATVEYVRCLVGVRTLASMHLQQQQICRPTASLPSKANCKQAVPACRPTASSSRPFLPAKSSFTHQTNRKLSCSSVSHPD